MAQTAEQRRIYQRDFARRYRADPIRRAEINARAREHRAANPDKFRARDNKRAAYNRGRSQAWRRANPVRTALQNYRLNARTRGLVLALTDAHITDLVTDNCFYCGAAPKPLNGIDRVDSSVGYVETNVVTACRACNIAKSNRPITDFVAWAGRISQMLPSWSDLGQ